MTTPTGDCWTDTDGEGLDGMENGNGAERRENGGWFSSQHRQREEGEMFGNFISNVMVVLKEGGGKRGGAREELQHLYDITTIR